MQSLIGGNDNEESFGNQDYEGNVFDDADEGKPIGMGQNLSNNANQMQF
mgnify:CR=1 FL=1